MHTRYQIQGKVENRKSQEKKQTSEIRRHDETETQSMCRKFGVQYECPAENETDK
jgi:hypothetical protein